MDRIELLQQIVDTYRRVLHDNDSLAPGVRAEFEARLAGAQVDLYGERGARGLNPETGEAA